MNCVNCGSAGTGPTPLCGTCGQPTSSSEPGPPTSSSEPGPPTPPAWPPVPPAWDPLADVPRSTHNPHAEPSAAPVSPAIPLVPPPAAAPQYASTAPATQYAPATNYAPPSNHARSPFGTPRPYGPPGGLPFGTAPSPPAPTGLHAEPEPAPPTELSLGALPMPALPDIALMALEQAPAYLPDSWLPFGMAPVSPPPSGLAFDIAPTSPPPSGLTLDIAPPPAELDTAPLDALSAELAGIAAPAEPAVDIAPDPFADQQTLEFPAITVASAPVVLLPSPDMSDTQEIPAVVIDQPATDTRVDHEVIGVMSVLAFVLAAVAVLFFPAGVIAVVCGFLATRRGEHLGPIGVNVAAGCTVLGIVLHLAS